MGLITRVYFNAVFGGLGGLLGWMLFSIFGNRTASDATLTFQFLTDGALIGGGIGYFVVSVEAIRDLSWLRFVRLATVGLLLGAVGGAIGMVVGDLVNLALISLLARLSGAPTGIFDTLFSAIARGLGFLFLGLAVGGSEGIAARSMGKFTYGTIGGTLGGLIGGFLFGLVYLLTLRQGGQASLAGAIGLVIVGACIGSLSALVQVAFQPASVKVLRGWQEGREYPLDREASILGRDEHADIALFRDMLVEKKHAVVRRVENRFYLVNNGAPVEQTRVNDQPVADRVELHDGDRIQLGNIVLRFQMQEARGVPRPRSAAVPAVPAR